MEQVGALHEQVREEMHEIEQLLLQEHLVGTLDASEDVYSKTDATGRAARALLGIQ